MLAVMDAERVLSAYSEMHQETPPSSISFHQFHPMALPNRWIKILPSGPAFGEGVQDAAGRFEWSQSRNDITVRVLHGLVDAPGKRLAMLVDVSYGDRDSLHVTASGAPLVHIMLYANIKPSDSVWHFDVASISCSR
mmetsp:Transcript_64043/g.143114  ORF Transcript_64043/g.143114 Transcript_64043/m.143114 type:complete len:137 (-) Transcript_64043:302-712(-)